MVEKRFAFDLELLVVARRMGYRSFVELPVQIAERFTTTISPQAVWRTLLDTLAIFYRLRVAHFYGPRLAPVSGHGPGVPLLAPGPGRGQALRTLAPDHWQALDLRTGSCGSLPTTGGISRILAQVALRFTCSRWHANG